MLIRSHSKQSVNSLSPRSSFSVGGSTEEEEDGSSLTVAPRGDAQLAKTGYHTGLIHFVQYFMEESVCMGSEGHVEPVDE